MLHVNDDTNDELFRRAADDYFLEANAPDWPSVLDKIYTAPGDAADNIKDKERRRWVLFFYTPLKRTGNKISHTLSWICTAFGLDKAKKKLSDNAGTTATVHCYCLLTG